MKDYYQILEVNKNASGEVIDKVYKVLAKRYHPDLQEASNAKEAEEKFKEVSEAYEILSDEEKRKKYDEELEGYENLQKSETVELSEFQKLRDYAVQLENEVSYLKNRSPNSGYASPNYTNNNFQQNDEPHQNDQDEPYQDTQDKAYQDALNKAYQDAYFSNLRDMGYKIRYKKTFKEFLKNVTALVLTGIIVAIAAFIVWHVPSLKSSFMSLFIIK